MRTLSIPINCGEKTCASAPGVFCKQIRTLKHGQIRICNIFKKELRLKTDGRNDVTNVYNMRGNINQ